MATDNWEDSNPMASFSEQEKFIEDYKLQAKLRYQRRKKNSNLYSKKGKSKRSKLDYNDEY